MSVRIKCEEVLLVDPKAEVVDFDEENTGVDVPTEFIEFPDTIEVSGEVEEKEDVILGRN